MNPNTRTDDRCRIGRGYLRVKRGWTDFVCYIQELPQLVELRRREMGKIKRGGTPKDRFPRITHKASSRKAQTTEQ